MRAGICCIHFHIYRSSHPEVFFKKGVLHLACLQENIHADNCEFNSTEFTLLYGYSSENMKHLQQNALVREHIWGTHSVYRFNMKVINVEVLHKQVKYYEAMV